MAVRRESVVLSLQDEFSTGMVKAAAATALLDKQLDHLSGSSVKTQNSTRSTSHEIDGLTRSSRDADASINQLTGRLRLFADAAAILAPTLAPIGGLGIAAVSGLTSSFGFAAIAAGTAVVAFQGVGDALKAVNKAQLEPTTANLDAARQALEGLSPAAVDFVAEIQKVMPQLKALRDASAEGLFPGVTAGLDALEGAFPRVQAIFTAISTELGNIAQETGESLASDRWAPFLDFVATEGPSALSQLAEAVGNTAHAFAGLWMSTTPLNRDFSQWLVDATADLDRWANALGQTDGFKEFVDYIETNGPQVAETFGAIASAAIQIVQAVAPLAGPVLQGIEGLANALAKVADSDLGTPIFGAVAALALLNRTMAITASLNKSTFGGAGAAALRTRTGAVRGYTSALGAATAASAGFGAVSAKQSAILARGNATLKSSGVALGALGLVSTGLADNLGLSNTATLALAGSLVGPWGAAIGGAAGLVEDLSAKFSFGGKEAEQYKAKLLAAAGPDVAAQIAAVTAEIEKQKAIVGDERFTLNLGITTLHSDDGAAKAAERVRELKKTLSDLTTQRDIDTIAAQRSTSAEAQWTAALADASSKQQANAAFTQAAIAKFDILGKSVNDSKVSLQDWIADMRKTAQAVADFGENAKKAADRGLRQGLIKQLEELGPAGALRLKQLANASKSELASANAAWDKYARAAKSAAKKVNDSLGGITTDEAIAAVISLQQTIDNLHGRDIKINVTANTNANLAELAAGSADGGTVPETGKPYADRHLYMLADGEEIISNRHGQADRNRPLLKAINADRMLASGGTTGKPKKSKPKDFLTQTEYNDALSQLVDGLTSALGLAPTGPAADVRAQFRSFAEQIKQNGGTVGKGFHVFEEDLVRSAVALDKQRKKVEEATQAVDDLKAAQASMVDTIKQAFTTDVFAKGFGQTDAPTVDASGLTAMQQTTFAGEIAKQNKDLAAQNAKDNQQAGLRQVLQDAKDATEFAKDLKALKDRGLTGSALAALANSGNLEQANALMSLSNGRLKQYSSAFAQRDQATAAAGAVAANVVIGEQLKDAKKALDLANKIADRQANLLEGLLDSPAAHRLAAEIGKESTKALTGAIKTGKGH